MCSDTTIYVEIYLNAYTREYPLPIYIKYEPKFKI